MPMFRARPRVVEAFLFNGQPATTTGLPQWYVDEILAGRLRLGPKQNIIDTPQGPMPCTVGDWLVRDELGIHPMRKDIFDKLYEPLPPGDVVQPAPPPVPEQTAEQRGLDWPIKG